MGRNHGFPPMRFPLNQNRISTAAAADDRRGPTFLLLVDVIGNYSKEVGKMADDDGKGQGGVAGARRAPRLVGRWVNGGGGGVVRYSGCW
jgi:hypothetical protein